MLSRLTLRFWHTLRGVHPDYVRHPLGGYRCECDFIGTDLGEMGMFGRESNSGFLRPTMKKYDRRDGSVERVGRWE